MVAKPILLRVLDYQCRRGDVRVRPGMQTPTQSEHVVTWLMLQPPSEQARYMQMLLLFRYDVFRQMSRRYRARFLAARHSAARGVRENRSLVITDSGIVLG